ncbi:MAG TPA: DUF2442 domain-containing protein [Anaerolineae bacterium]|nr:DUF2442 domain-containing protein [Anaerolineae bacterium]
MDKFHTVEINQIDDTFLYLTVDGQSYRVRWSDCSPKLATATIQDRRRIQVSPSGYGLHWRDLDEDLAINPLLQIAEHLADTPTHA